MNNDNHRDLSFGMLSGAVIKIMNTKNQNIIKITRPKITIKKASDESTKRVFLLDKIELMWICEQGDQGVAQVVKRKITFGDGEIVPGALSIKEEEATVNEHTTEQDNE